MILSGIVKEKIKPDVSCTEKCSRPISVINPTFKFIFDLCADGQEEGDLM